MQQMCSLTLPLILSCLLVTSESSKIESHQCDFLIPGNWARKLTLYAVNLLLLFVLDMVVKCVEWLTTLWPACKSCNLGI